MTGYLWKRVMGDFVQRAPRSPVDKDMVIREIIETDSKLDKKFELAAKEYVDCLGDGFVSLKKVTPHARTLQDTKAMKMISQRQGVSAKETRQVAQEFDMKYKSCQDKIEHAKRINECGMEKMQEILKAKGL